MINVGIAGAQGRMGQLLIEALAKESDLKLVVSLVRANADYVEEMIEKLTDPLEVLIDFSPPSAVLKHLSLACKHHYRIVIGSTGFTDAEKEMINQAATVIPIVFAANMSMVANITYKILALVAKMLPEKADAAILDIHHKHKKDRPSGTALRMAEIIRETREKNKVDPIDVPVTSIRMGESVGEHKIFFSLEEERLEITHKTFNRLAYAKGALQAARWLMNCTPGLYDMQDVLGLKIN